MNTWRHLSDERGGVATPLMFTLVVFVLALFLSLAVAIPAFAAQQAQSVTDEMWHTAEFIAASTRGNVAGSEVVQGHLESTALATASALLRRPVEGQGLGDAPDAVGGAYVRSVAIGAVRLLAPGDAVPGASGLTATEQGVALTYTEQVAMLGGLVHETLTRTVWAFPGSL